jgi:hypothetical protein
MLLNIVDQIDVFVLFGFLFIYSVLQIIVHPKNPENQEDQRITSAHCITSAHRLIAPPQHFQERPSFAW